MKTPLTNKDFSLIKALSNLKANPNKTKLAFIKSDINLEKNKPETNLWIYDGQELKQMSQNNDVAHFEWLDDNRLLFLSKRSQDNKENSHQSDLYCLDLRGGEAFLFTRFSLEVSSFRILDDHRFLVIGNFPYDEPNAYHYSQDKWKKVDAANKEKEDVIEVDEIPYYTNGGSFIGKKRNRLFYVDQKQKLVKPLFSANQSIWSISLNPKKDKALVTLVSYKDVLPLTNQVYEINLKSLEVKPRLKNQKLQVSSLVILEEETYLFASDMKAYGLNQNANLYRLTEDDQLILLKEDLDLGNSIGSDCRLGGSPFLVTEKDHFTFLTTYRYGSRLLEVKKDQVTPLHTRPYSIDGFDWINKKLTLIGIQDTRPQELYQLDQKDQWIRLSNFNSFMDDKTVVAPTFMPYHNREGLDLDGWVLYPPTYDPKKTYPAILDIHGGPKTVYGPIYYHEMQVWANAGYIVFFTNPRGSSGRGNAFSDIFGRYGTIDYQDLMDFTDHVLKAIPAIDKNRVGVTGGSYGGFMTNWILGHTDRFKAAVTQRSISNWLSFQGVSDIGFYFTGDQNKANFFSEKGQAALWEASPIKYAKNFKTPTLIIHSDQDYRCPLEQGLQMLTALKSRKVKSKLLIFKNENHDLSRSGRPKARLKRLEAILDWFKTHLK